MLKVFVGYSKADAGRVDGLMVHLKGLEYEGIEMWHDGQIVPGEEWAPRIQAQLVEADIIIFCVSADLLATDYVQDVEIPTAIARHDRGEATVIPVIFRKCAWQGHELGRLQGIPAKDRTVQDYVREDNTDEIWTEVATAVRSAARRRKEADVQSRPRPTRLEAPPETWVRSAGAKPVILSSRGQAKTHATGVTGWRGGTWGLRVQREHFETNRGRLQREPLILELPGVDAPLRVCLSPSFWRNCPEVRSAAIGRWMRSRGDAPWESGRPPKYRASLIVGREIILRVDGPH